MFLPRCCLCRSKLTRPLDRNRLTRTMSTAEYGDGDRSDIAESSEGDVVDDLAEFMETTSVDDPIESSEGAVVNNLAETKENATIEGSATEMVKDTTVKDVIVAAGDANIGAINDVKDGTETVVNAVSNDSTGTADSTAVDKETKAKAKAKAALNNLRMAIRAQSLGWSPRMKFEFFMFLDFDIRMKIW